MLNNVNLRVLLLAFLLLATDVFAGRISYTAKYTIGGNMQRTSKLANVPNDKEQLIIDNMGAWSDNKYTASHSKHNMVLVTNVEAAASKGQASEEVQEMQTIVNQHIK